MEKGSTFLQGLIKSKLKTRAIITAIIFCVSCVGIWYHFSYIKSFFAEPVMITSRQDAADNFNGGRNYVQIHADNLYDAYYEVETITKRNGIETGRELTSFFVFAEFDEGTLILIELPYSYDNEDAQWEDVTLKGVLKKEPKALDVFKYSSEYIAKEFGIDAQLVLDEVLAIVYLDTISYDIGETSNIITFISLLGAIISVLYSIYLVILAIDYKKAKLYRQLKNYGDADAIESLIQREYDNRNESLIASNGDEYIFKSYIVSGDHWKVRPTAELIWAYKKTVRSKSGKSYSIILSFKGSEKPLTLSISSDSEADRVLSDIAEKLPVMCDYDKSLEKMYNKNRAEFMAHYEKYMSQLNAARSFAEGEAESASSTENNDF